MLTDLVAEMDRLRSQLDELEDKRKPIQARYEHLRLVAIPTAMAEEDITSITVSGVGRCTLTGDMYVRVLDRPALHIWLQDTGNESLITETINAQTLKSFIKEQQKSGVEVPDAILDVTPFVRAVVYRN
jgi:hypothetical protein